GGLAGAIGAEQSDDLAGFDMQGKVLHHDAAAIGLAQVAGAQHRAGGIVLRDGLFDGTHCAVLRSGSRGGDTRSPEPPRRMMARPPVAGSPSSDTVPSLMS